MTKTVRLQYTEEALLERVSPILESERYKGLHYLPYIDYVRDLTQYRWIEEAVLTEVGNFNNEIEYEDMWDLSEMNRRLAANWCLHLLFFQERVLGWAWYNPERNFIQNVYVNKDHRRKGFGNFLVAQGMLWGIREMKADNIYAQVDSWNVPSMKMFKKLGWRS